MAALKVFSFAIITVANRYWLVDGHPYAVREVAYVADDDPTYLAWAASHTPLVATSADLRAALLAASLPPFRAVSALQARRALRAAGLFDQVSAAVTASTDLDLKDSWEYATEWRRDAAWIATVGAQLNLTDVQIDALFVTAATL
jgi:hypothetical protein